MAAEVEGDRAPQAAQVIEVERPLAAGARQRMDEDDRRGAGAFPPRRSIRSPRSPGSRGSPGSGGSRDSIGSRYSIGSIGSIGADIAYVEVAARAGDPDARGVVGRGGALGLVRALPLGPPRRSLRDLAPVEPAPAVGRHRQRNPDSH